MNSYLSWGQKIELEKRANFFILKVFYEDSKKNKFKKWKNYLINDTAYEIIKLINGIRTYDEVVNYLSEKYNEEYESIKEKLDYFFSFIETKYQLTIKSSQQIVSHNEEVVINESYYPKAASIEITNACNLKCLHCYGDFGHHSNSNAMSLKDLKEVLNKLNDVGVEVVELTGGDITMHPKINEIIKYALTLGFIKIALLTNGVLLKEETLKLIIKNKERIMVQIDLHSLNDSYLDWFTGLKNTLNPICKNINFLSTNGALIRVAVMITQKNIDELDEIADWVHSLDNTTLGIGLVTKMGRANQNDELILNDENITSLNNKLICIQEKYQNFLSIIDDYDTSKSNCGCLSTGISITSNGKLKLCAMDSGDYFDSGLGNLLFSSVREIYDENKKYINAVENLRAPQIDTEQCSGCNNLSFCGKCILRSFVKAGELKECCRWYQECVPEIIKQKIKI